MFRQKWSVVGLKASPNAEFLAGVSRNYSIIDDAMFTVMLLRPIRRFFRLCQPKLAFSTF